MSDAKFLKPALLGKIRPGGVGEHTDELYSVTLGEANDKSWLCGQNHAAEFDRPFEGVWLPVPRFPVENRVNDAFSSSERATLYALDHIIWSSIFLMWVTGLAGRFVLHCLTGWCLKAICPFRLAFH